MDYKRAKQIFNSPEIIDVTYHGIPVWIEEVRQTSARVSAHEFGAEEKTVPLDELREEAPD